MNPFSRKPGISVIEIHGIIGKTIRESDFDSIFRKAEHNKKIAAVVLDIDSPGGAVGETDLIYQRVEDIAKKKPVVAHIRNIGASGGYYIACGSETIYASRAALVGSIGVIYARPIIQELMDKVGIKLSVSKAGRLKDMTAFWRSPTEEEENKLNQIINEMYQTFTAIVSKKRGIEIKAVEEIATGEIYTAKQALANHLIDHIGNISHAVNEAKTLSKAKGKVKTYRVKRPFLERIQGSNKKNPVAAIQNMVMPFEPGFNYLEPALANNIHLP